MKSRVHTLLLVAIVLTAAPAGADTEFEGQTAGGAFFKAIVPDGWSNGDLVISNHGFSLRPIGPDFEEELFLPLDVLLADGFAVAASSYRQIGWALFKTDRDLELMVEAFRQRFGAPGRIILTGESLGGIVAASALERANLGNVVGAFTLCGAMAGSRNWDGFLDLRLLYDAICAGVPGAEIPGGPTGLPRNSDLTEDQVLAALNACTGLAVSKSQRTKAQRRRLRRLVKLSRFPKEFLPQDMIGVTFGLADLIYDRRKLRGKQGIGNDEVDYGKAKINAKIERVAARRKAARRLRRNFTPEGDVGDAKIMNLHTDKDGLVIVENQREYQDVVPEEQLVVGIVREQTPSHCGFNPAEVLGPWMLFLDWLGGADKPEPENLQTACEEAAADFGGPCRFDPDFEIPDMDTRFRPRG